MGEKVLPREIDGLPVREMVCDVLVVGGGLAGIAAARAAAGQGARVIMAAKGFTGADGASVFAGGVVLYLQPEDDWAGFLHEHEVLCEGLAIPDVLQAVAQTNTELWQRLAAEGAPLERDEDGGLKRRWLPIASRKYVPRLRIDSVKLMRHLRQQVLRTNTRIVDQTVVTRLLTDSQGSIIGAVGVARQTGELMVFWTPTVILATGGCSWRGAHMGQHNLMGDGYALAALAGAQLSSMEFSASYLATSSLFDSHGQCVLAAIGGRYVNKYGEEITQKYASSYPPAPQHIALAMLSELKAGGGPIKFDLRGINDADRQDWQAGFPLVHMGLVRSGLDIFQQPTPWFPGFTGSIGAGGGVRTLNLAGQTTVTGLYAVGDTAARVPLVGAGSGITFLNLAWALTSGYWAGQAAGSSARPGSQGTGNEFTVAERLVAAHRLPQSWERNGFLPRRAGEALAATLAPLTRSKPAAGFTAEKQRHTGTQQSESAAIVSLLNDLQRLVIHPDWSFFRSAPVLTAADEQLQALSRRVLSLTATDLHDLVRCHELQSAVLTAQAMFKSAQLRRETRGWHWRHDFPAPAAKWSRLWTTVGLGADGQLETGTVHMGGPGVFDVQTPLGVDGQR